MSSETKQILTTDGIPLEVSLKKAEKKNKIKAFLLVAPLLFFFSAFFRLTSKGIPSVVKICFVSELINKKGGYK